MTEPVRPYEMPISGFAVESRAWRLGCGQYRSGPGAQVVRRVSRNATSTGPFASLDA